MTGPSKYAAVANGIQVGETINADGTKTTEYSLKHPCPSYLICFGIGDFTVVDDGEVDGIPIKYLGPKSMPGDHLHRAFDKTPSMIRWLSNKLGMKFPWPKYYQISAPEIGGAMENISLVTWSDLWTMDEKYASERKLMVDSVNIHEMAHTYFGDVVVIRFFEHAWLKESWATYIESVWMEENVGLNEFQYEMLENADSYIAETSKYMRPIVSRTYDSSWMMFDMHTYPGGCWRLHMLRKLLGDDVFWTGVRNYIQENAYKTVETNTFKEALERASGINLNRFFDQWIYGKGFPKLKGTYEYIKEKNLVVVTLEQTQVDKKMDIPSFDFDIEIEVTDIKGEQYSAVAHFDETKKTFVAIPIQSVKPKMIRIDPNQKILFTLDMNPGEDVLEEGLKSGDISTKVWCYRELAKIGTSTAYKKIQEALIKEPFWGVRVKGMVAPAFFFQFLSRLLFFA